jgi:hypothetical protein
MKENTTFEKAKLKNINTLSSLFSFILFAINSGLRVQKRKEMKENTNFGKAKLYNNNTLFPPFPFCSLS